MLVAALPLISTTISLIRGIFPDVIAPRSMNSQSQQISRPASAKPADASLVPPLTKDTQANHADKVA